MILVLSPKHIWLSMISHRCCWPYDIICRGHLDITKFHGTWKFDTLYFQSPFNVFWWTPWEITNSHWMLSVNLIQAGTQTCHGCQLCEMNQCPPWCIGLVSPLCAELVLRNIRIYFQSLLFIHIDMLFPHKRQRLIRACLFSKSSLAWLQEIWISSICLYEIERVNLFKSTCPTGSFTCPLP